MALAARVADVSIAAKTSGVGALISVSITHCANVTRRAAPWYRHVTQFSQKETKRETEYELVS